MPGYVGILTADEVKNPPAPEIQLSPISRAMFGAPILLLAAESETAAQDALEKIRIVWSSCRSMSILWRA